MCAPGRVTGKRILLVDDQPEVRQVLKMLLEVDQHFVTEAGNGCEALACFQPGRFDLVITDYAMPQMRGDELARRIKEVAPGQPILMVTGSPNDSEMPKVDLVLCKPFLFDDLRQSLGQLLTPVPA